MRCVYLPPGLLAAPTFPFSPLITPPIPPMGPTGSSPGGAPWITAMGSVFNNVSGDQTNTSHSQNISLTAGDYIQYGWHF
jgi:hypothetical protein